MPAPTDRAFALAARGGFGRCWDRPRLLTFLAWAVLHWTVTWTFIARLNITVLLTGLALGPDDVRPRPGETTDVEVIVASPGTSGTRSMYVALSRMGLRTWKFEELGFYLPHVVRPEVAPEELVGPLRATGVQALVLEPWLNLVPKVLAVSPKAKVVLSMRNYSVWQHSRVKQVQGYWGNFFPNRFEYLRALCHHLPVALFWLHPEDRYHGFLRHTVTSVLKRDCIQFFIGPRCDPRLQPSFDQFLPENPENRTGMLQSESNYEWYRRYVKEIVPPERLLEFTPDMGWEPFAHFLGRPIPEGAVGTPWPRTAPGKSQAESASLHEDPLGFFTAWALNLLCLLLNISLFCGCVQCTPRALARAGRACRLTGERRPKEA